jgi:hypothetical protein
MKYLRRYNESYEDNKSIDWEFISNAKHLSLEHIDDGWTLYWGVECLTSMTSPKEYRTFTVVSGKFDHEEDITEWGYNFDEDDDLSEEEISYVFYFSKEYKLPGDSYQGRILNKEFREKVKTFYPDKIVSKIQ